MLFTSRFPAGGNWTWLNSVLSLVKRKFYQTVNVRKISRSWLVFPLRKSQGQLGIYHPLTEGKCAVRVTFSSTWKTGLNSSFSLVNRKFYHTVNVVKILRSWLLFRLRITQGKLNIHRPVTWPGKHAVHFTSCSLAHKRDSTWMRFATHFTTVISTV